MVISSMADEPSAVQPANLGLQSCAPYFKFTLNLPRSWAKGVELSRAMREKLADQMGYPPRAMRARGAAAYLSISVATFHRWVQEGVIPPPVRLGGTVLWDRYALDAVLDRLGDEHAENTVHKLLAQGAKHHEQTSAQRKTKVSELRKRLRLLSDAKRQTDPPAD